MPSREAGDWPACSDAAEESGLDPLSLIHIYSIAFWDSTHGIVLGDPIPDESGQLKFQLLLTTDGQSWTPIPPSQLPRALDGEGAFAASNRCLAILPSNDPNIWFASGGKRARVFHLSLIHI